MPYRLNVVYRRFQPTTSNNEQCRLAAEGKKRKNRFDDQSKQEKKEQHKPDSPFPISSAAQTWPKTFFFFFSFSFACFCFAPRS
jgi:hypothetical protein